MEGACKLTPGLALCGRTPLLPQHARDLGAFKSAAVADSSADAGVVWCKELIKLRGLAVHNQRKHEMRATHDEATIQRWSHGTVVISLISAALSGGGVVASLTKTMRAAALVSMGLSLAVTYGSLMIVTPEKLTLVSERRRVAAAYSEVKHAADALRLRVTQERIETAERVRALEALRARKQAADAAGSTLPAVGTRIYRQSKAACCPLSSGEDPLTKDMCEWNAAVRSKTMDDARRLAAAALR